MTPSAPADPSQLPSCGSTAAGRPVAQTAPAAVQSVVAGNSMVTASCESGRTPIVQRPFWPAVAWADSRTVPLVTRNAAPFSTACSPAPPARLSLKRSSKRIMPRPSCDDGMSANAAVSAGGPEMVADVLLESGRPSDAQTAPAAVQSVVAGNSTVTSW